MNKVQHCRINLQNHTFKKYKNSRILNTLDTDKLLEIYDRYCEYHNFISPFPFYKEQFAHIYNNIIGYTHNNKLVAWSMIYLFKAFTKYSLSFFFISAQSLLHFFYNYLLLQGSYI